MQYKLSWIEQKEWNGKKYASAGVTALDGTELDVSLGDKWGIKLPMLREGDTIEANAWQNPKNGKWSLYPPEDRKTPSEPRRPSQSANIERVMQKKEASIGKFQDNKELSIKISSTMRDAVLIALAEYNDARSFTFGETIGENIEGWRKWFWEHWDDPETDATYPD